MKYSMLALALVFCCTSAALPARRTILVVNAGNEAIFSLHFGDASAQSWGPDLLTFDQVIDVSRGLDVPVDLAGTQCRLDVQARYGDGHEEVDPNVDLCSGQRVSFDH